jgi:hypothetical protein
MHHLAEKMSARARVCDEFCLSGVYDGWDLEEANWRLAAAFHRPIRRGLRVWRKEGTIFESSLRQHTRWHAIVRQC